MKVKAIFIIIFNLAQLSVFCQTVSDSLTIELKKLADDNSINGFDVAIYSKDSILYKSGLGFADVENKIPYTTQTVQKNAVKKAQPNQGIPFYTVLVNIVPDSFNFPLVGFVNFAKGTHESLHLGFINWNQINFSGCQIGYVNYNGGKVKGAQIGFINRSASLHGVQLGFVNIIDSLTSGIPLGLFSFIRKGGYRAIETSVTEMFPLNISYKMGVKKLYTNYTFSYNSNLEGKLTYGIGLGSILSLDRNIYFNPEVMMQNKLLEGNPILYSLGLHTGYRIYKKIHANCGPSIVWFNARQKEDIFNEFYSLKKWIIDEQNILLVGFRVGVRYALTDSEF